MNGTWDAGSTHVFDLREGAYDYLTLVTVHHNVHDGWRWWVSCSSSEYPYESCAGLDYENKPSKAETTGFASAEEARDAAVVWITKQVILGVLIPAIPYTINASMANR